MATTSHRLATRIRPWRLPAELLVYILDEVSLKELLSCTLVCKEFRHTIKGSLLLQYHIALARVGAVDGPHSPLTTAQRMARLEAQERAWLYITPTRRDVVSIPRRFSSFDLCGGMLVGARAPEPSTTILPFTHAPPPLSLNTGPDPAITILPPHPANADAQNANDIGPLTLDVDVEDFNSCEMIATQLPSVIGDRSDMASWTHNVGFPVYGLTVDPSQDLAVLIEARPSASDNLRVHLRSLSTFLPHPMASQPLLELEVGEGNPSIAQLSSRCLHNLVGVLLNCVEGDLYRQKLVIWDWRLGIMRTCLDSSKEGRTIDDFSFLTTDTVIIPVRRPAPATLDIYKIEPITRRSGRLGRNNPAPAATRIMTFELPEMRSPLQVSINPITCNSDPLPTPPSQISSQLPSTLHHPFYLDPRKSLLSFSFLVCHGHHTHIASPLHERFTLLVQRKYILERVENVLNSSQGRKGLHQKTVVVKWPTWGPKSSRFLTEKHLSWACFAYGTRVVMAPSAQGTRSQCRLRVLDFNPFVVAREQEKQRARKEKLSKRLCSPDYEGVVDSDEEDGLEMGTVVRVVDEPTIIRSGKVFKNDVHTQLPYRESTTVELFNFANVVIDEERIGGLVINESGDLSACEILTM